MSCSSVEDTPRCTEVAVLASVVGTVVVAVVVGSVGIHCWREGGMQSWQEEGGRQQGRQVVLKGMHHHPLSRHLLTGTVGNPTCYSEVLK